MGSATTPGGKVSFHRLFRHDGAEPGHFWVTIFTISSEIFSISGLLATTPESARKISHPASRDVGPFAPTGTRETVEVGKVAFPEQVFVPPW